MSIEQIVDVQISRETATVTAAGFGRALILGVHIKTAELIKTYTSLTAVADDFDVTDEEYKAAAKLFGQSIKPPDIAIGKRATAVAQVNDIEISTLEDADYTVTINGTDFTYTPGGVPADESTVTNALIALIAAGAEPVTASASGTPTTEDLVLTADVAGEPFTVAVTTNMTNVATTANNGVQEDLAAIVASGDLGSDWYALCLISRSDVDIMQGAIWIEANKKLFIAASDAAAILTAVSTDIASLLNAAAYDRTALIYSADQASYPDAAWLGKMLPKDPGSATWALKTLAGITKDELTDTEITNLKAKKANYYIEIGGVNITQGGNVASGEWLDVIRGIDWIEARSQENIFALLVVVDKIPFTNAGIDQVTNKLQEILTQAVDRGILTTFDITRPLASSFTSIQKQSRELTGIEFTGTLAGAVHKVTVVGKVSV
jgi:Protein of unknown function (DUF3383)